MAVMQNDGFKKFSKDLQDALVMPVQFLNKKAKKTPLSEKKKPSGLTMTGLDRASGGNNNNNHHHHHHHSHSAYSSTVTTPSTADSVSLHNFSLSTISKASSDDNQSFTSTNGLQYQLFLGGKGQRSRASSFLRSPLSPGGFGSLGFGSNNGSSGGGHPKRAFPKLHPMMMMMQQQHQHQQHHHHVQQQLQQQQQQQEEPALVHCPPSVGSLDQLSSERQAWVRECLAQNHHPNLKPLPSSQQQQQQQEHEQQPDDILKSGRAWETAEGHFEEQGCSAELIAPGRSFVKSGYNNLNEATGLVLVKLMQVSNRASSKIFDIECNLRIGNVERTSHPSRSFKDSPGNTATMNEVFLFDVNEPFELELEVTGIPVATKFGTIAGFANTQQVHFGQLHLPLGLQPMEKSVRTYKLQRTISTVEGSQPNSAASIKSLAKEKFDCEIVIMMGVHVLEEPIEDRSWETQTHFEGNLTVMTRGSRMAAWKRYWAVLEGTSLKLYDAEYQLKREPIAIIPLAHLQGVQPPDYDKVDVGSNGFSLAVSHSGVDMMQASEFDLEDMDYHVYAFADSAHLLENWKGHLDEALDQYRENMMRREEVQDAKRRRRRRQGRGMNVDLGRMEHTEEDIEEAEEEVVPLIDLRFVS
ncbi:unnamed protein product [Mortierella alpina]